MRGTVDDYLRDVSCDQKVAVLETDIIQAGTACIKRAYQIFVDQKYESKLMPAGMRGAYHATALAGADMSMSLSPKICESLKSEEKIKGDMFKPVSQDIISRLMRIREFKRAYEPDGMDQTEFITYGATQRTLSQFSDAGWKYIEEYQV